MINETKTEETELNDDEKKLLEELLNDELSGLSEQGDARRKFLKQVSAASAAILATQLLSEQNVLALLWQANLFQIRRLILKTA